MTKKAESNVGKEKTGKKQLPKDMGPGKENREFTRDFLRHLFYTQGRTLEMATPNDLYMALGARFAISSLNAGCTRSKTTRSQGFGL